MVAHNIYRLQSFPWQHSCLCAKEIVCPVIDKLDLRCCVSYYRYLGPNGFRSDLKEKDGIAVGDESLEREVGDRMDECVTGKVQKYWQRRKCTWTPQTPYHTPPSPPSPLHVMVVIHFYTILYYILCVLCGISTWDRTVQVLSSHNFWLHPWKTEMLRTVPVIARRSAYLPYAQDSLQYTVLRSILC